MLAAGLWLAVAAPVQAAADSVDQSQQSASSSNSLTTTAMAQTFTAEASGQLDRVTLMMAASGTVTATVQIQSVSGGKPSGTVLGSNQFSGSVTCCHRWNDFAISPAVPVVAGTQYAIVVKPLTGTFVWYDSFTFDAYGAGQLWQASGSDWVYQPASLGFDFCFETWVVAGGPNQPPTIAADSAAVTANEGSPASNTGTFSDPDGDAVTLSASLGTVVKTGTSSGTWTWSAPAADESAAQAITVTATDSNGGSSLITFTVLVAGAPPVVAITGAAASSPEGTAMTLTGSVTAPSAEDTAGLTLTWTVTKNGLPYSTGAGTSLTVTPDDEGAFVATLHAVDDGGNSATNTVSFSGANVSPTASITGVAQSLLILVARQPVSFSGKFADPGAQDTHTGTFVFGDGTSPAVTTYPAGAAGAVTTDHAYAKAGTYTVTYTVTDDDGGISTATVKVTVDTLAGALAAIDAYVQKLTTLSASDKRELSAMLQEAIKQGGRTNTREMCKSVDSFLSELTALTKDHKLSASDSAALSAAAWSVHRALGCRKIRWGWFELDL